MAVWVQATAGIIVAVVRQTHAVAKFMRKHREISHRKRQRERGFRVSRGATDARGDADCSGVASVCHQQMHEVRSVGITQSVGFVHEAVLPVHQPAERDKTVESVLGVDLCGCYKPEACRA